MIKIHFQNKKAFQEKIKQIKKDGLDKFHVTSDFDNTLTKCFIDGKKTPSTIALIRGGDYLSKDYAKRASALYHKYHPFEIDESLDFEYKFSKMKEWWEIHRDLLLSSGMRKEIVEDIISKFPRIFRGGVLEFLNELHKNNIPLIIFSAGIGNIIEGSLKKFNRLTNNITILSNYFDFDDNGFAKGYKNEIIHALNKSEIKIEDEKYKQLISQRKNVLLLGDSIGDLGMINEMDYNVIIKIGFLNNDIDKNLELYKSEFDIVITNDGDFEFVNKLIKELLRNNY